MPRQHAQIQRRLTHGNQSQPVDEKNLLARMRRAQFVDDARELLLRHRLVGLVKQRGNRFAIFHFADDAMKFHARTNFAQ
jgi:hypothetical protein